MILRRVLPLVLGGLIWTSSSKVALATVGEDLIFLAEIVTNTANQLYQLKKILGAGKDTLDILREVNRGIGDALQLAKTLPVKVGPGVLSNLGSIQESMSAVERLYGKVPVSPESDVQKTTDQSVAEAIHLHSEAYRYAQEIDPQVEMIKSHSKVVNPQGAGKLTAESLGVVAGVMNQVLRTNAAMLKLESERLAMENRRQKLGTEQFKSQYKGIATAFRDLEPSYDLPSLSR